jgi:hypothetical protein
MPQIMSQLGFGLIETYRHIPLFRKLDCRVKPRNDTISAYFLWVGSRLRRASPARKLKIKETGGFPS